MEFKRSSESRSGHKTSFVPKRVSLTLSGRTLGESQEYLHNQVEEFSFALKRHSFTEQVSSTSVSSPYMVKFLEELLAYLK